MSILTFELKKEHLLLLKHLRWSITKKDDKNNIVGVEDDETPPFGADNLYEAIDLILNGKPEGFDPLKDDPITYSNEQMEVMDNLYSELPTALDVVLYNGHFELGNYVTRFHDRQWRKKNG